MKIGIVLHPYGEKMPGGLPRVIFEWTKALLLGDHGNEYLLYLKHVPKEPLPLPGKNWQSVVLGPGLFWLDRLGRKPEADVYIFNTPVLPFFFRPKKSILIVYDFPYKYLPPRSLYDRMRRIAIGWYHGRSLRRATHIVAVSHSTKRDIVKFFNIPEEKVTVLYHGFKSICAVAEETVPLPDKFFFFAGTLKERKNVHRIVEAFISLRKRRSDIRHKLVLGGKTEGAYYEKMRERIGAAGFSGEVLFAGYLSDGKLSYAYKRADALVFPSTVEGTGNPILEAMDCGIPVITSNIFGPAELGGGAALLVDPFDVRALEGAMEQVATNPKLREELIGKGRERVKQFSWDAAVTGMLRIVRKIGETRE